LTEQAQLLSVDAFWDKIEQIFNAVKQWVLRNCEDKEYQCCATASDIMYRALIEWGIGKYIDVEYCLKIVNGHIEHISHDWVEVLGYIYDPTAMQFETEPTFKDYMDGWFYDEDDYEPILKSEKIAGIVKEILKEVEGEPQCQE